MPPDNLVFIYGSALMSNLTFGLSSVFFGKYSKKISAVWVNCIKAIVGLIAFFLTLILFYEFHEITQINFVLALVSGAIGLCLADILLLRSFAVLGAGRTLLLFGFQPVIFGIFAYILFGQTFALKNLVAIFIFLICLILFSFERKSLVGRFDVKAFLIALLAICLDATGVLITRYVFENSPNVTPLEVNFYRAIGALLCFLILSPWLNLKLTKRFLAISLKDRFQVILVSFTGCYIALLFYLQAVQHAHLATLSAMTVFGPLSASLLECILEKRKPSWQQSLAFILFFIALIFVFS